MNRASTLLVTPPPAATPETSESEPTPDLAAVGRQALAANRPLLLDDPAAIWRVEQGPVELFAVAVAGGQPVGARQHLFRAETGLVLAGADLAVSSYGLLVSGVSGRELRRLDRAELLADRAGRLLVVAWCEQLRASLAELAPTGSRPSAGEPADAAGLDRFHREVLVALAAGVEAAREAERERHAARTRADEALRLAAQGSMAGIGSPSRSGRWAAIEGADPLLAACRLVGESLGVKLGPPPGGTTGAQPLEAIVRASRLRTRRVVLRGAWWRQPSGPLVGYRSADHRPIALVPRGDGYLLLDPVERRTRRVTAAVAARLDPRAESFYRRLDDRPLSAARLLGFGLRGAGRDLLTMLGLALAIGLVGLLGPLVVGALFAVAIPGAHRSLLIQLGAGLAVAALAAALFQVTRDLAILRLSGRLQAALEPAIMDRLLELPATFFRRYSAGDLAGRVLAIGTLREALTGPLLSTLLSSLFAALNLAVLFALDARLALVACALLLGLVAFVLGSSYHQLRLHRALGEHSGRLSGTVLQLINGIAKLRAAGAEARAFAFWAERFSAQRRIAYQARRVANRLAVFTAGYPLLATAALFGVVAVGLQPAPSLGHFLAFNAAFGQLIAAAVGLIEATSALYQAAPAFERARPLLQTSPEVDASRADPGELSGAVDVSAVSFRYGDGPLVLDNVSLEARPGELVALVGPSGSGKSTLLRLLLGFETPAAGAILYDRRDLALLDVGAVRRQIGTVLQHGRLLAGDVFTNIVGAAALTVEDAWEAARLAGLDEDIRALPMGMHTLLSDGANTLSVGQRQRLLIARAIVHRPRLLLLDESTSALDNRTQELVGRGLAGLAATRLVIAHRLSTVVDADRIYVLDEGRVVERGTYAELMRQEGLFSRLARRQLV